ncbi:MAG TPA: Sir2 family NAD-dependent protein deacetylase [Vulgatibacter sp.]|nr:Sir2 family NAD-dependent protein deacetylase [Vulgatibacter sp.]
MTDLFDRAAQAIVQADALLVTAGAGMGVDSGLPDFRGPEGFWRAYPPYRELGLRFEELAQPRWFSRDPRLAWGFYGHRLELYRATTPHQGFEILCRWVARKRGGAFVFTSNVDGHFQRAGFDEAQVIECHGSLMHLQCTESDCGIHPASDVRVDVDPITFRAAGPLPSCPVCGALARPNVLMFADGGWDDARTAAAEARFASWLSGVAAGRLAIVELGAGTAVPSVRMTGEAIARRHAATLVRINVREPAAPPPHLGIARGALDALREIDRRLG